VATNVVCFQDIRISKWEQHPTFKSDFDTGKMYFYACVFNTALVVYLEKTICKGKSMDLAISGRLLCSNGSCDA
jgi:hypothetical protein